MPSGRAINPQRDQGLSLSNMQSIKKKEEEDSKVFYTAQCLQIIFPLNFHALLAKACRFLVT